VFLYCLAPDRFMVVVNAANAERVTAWLNSVNARQAVIDLDWPHKEVDVTATIRDLKSPGSGTDQHVGLSLQGPRSLAVLQALSPTTPLGRLSRLEFVLCELAGVSALVSRTGYTGEALGYEIYTHPDQASPLWNAILNAGRTVGLKPAGLGARDSTRTEAGFPLYGHELAGKYAVSPAEAGYGAFVKLHKPFFIGRKPYIERMNARKMEIVRFQLDARGPMIRPDDPVASDSGQDIGYVTSCVLAQGFKVGLAYVSREFAKEGMRIRITPLPRTARAAAEKSKASLPQEAVVLPRFRPADVNPAQRTQVT
jgi:glycine hydroxymethyltransferase